AWMATFSDLMTQILTFFVFLFTMSVIDMEKAQEALVSFNNAFGGITNEGMRTILQTNYVVPYPETTRDPMLGASGKDISQMQLEEALHDIVFFVKANSTEDSVDGSFDSKGNVEIQVNDNLMFDLGKADIKPEAYPLLKRIGEILKKTDNDIVIEGHTDNVPIIKGPFASNWELSAARALEVNKYLIKNASINPKHISIAGYGEFKPKVNNDTAENRSKNRRVTIIIVKKQQIELY
ncbi:MAG: hypothetical protein A2Y40_05605, partial [Candidatus Margulisbacteria bacterium GWF2_35_9]